MFSTQLDVSNWKKSYAFPATYKKKRSLLVMNMPGSELRVALYLLSKHSWGLWDIRVPAVLQKKCPFFRVTHDSDYIWGSLPLVVFLTFLREGQVLINLLFEFQWNRWQQPRKMYLSILAWYSSASNRQFSSIRKLINIASFNTPLQTSIVSHL